MTTDIAQLQQDISKQEEGITTKVQADIDDLAEVVRAIKQTLQAPPKGIAAAATLPQNLTYTDNSGSVHTALATLAGRRC